MRIDRRHLSGLSVIAGMLLLLSCLATARDYASLHTLPAAPADYPKLPGKWSYFPDVLTAGSSPETVQLRYEHTGPAMPAGTIHRVLLEPVTIVDFLHADPSEGMKLIPYKGEPPNIEIDPARVNGVGFRKVDFIFPDGMKPGDSFAVELGNEVNGEIKPLVSPLNVRDLTMETYTVFNGTRQVSWFNKTWKDGLAFVTIRAGGASVLRLFVPSRIGPGKPFDLRIAVCDSFDNRSSPRYTGKIELQCDGITALPSSVALTEKDRSFVRLENLSAAKEGIFRIRARLAGGKWFESNPMVVRKGAGAPIFWGMCHLHTRYSEGWGDTLDETFAQGKEMAGFDFLSTSDHKGARPQPGRGAGRLTSWRDGAPADSQAAWEDNLRSTEKFNEPGRFLTFSGYELSTRDSGHYNIYWKDNTLANMIEMQNMHFLPYYSDYIGHVLEFLKSTDALLIPHMHSADFPYFCFYDARNDAGEPLVPSVELYSDWGGWFQANGVHSPDGKYGGQRSPNAWSFLEFLERGYVVGSTGDADHHGGYPGKRCAAGIAPEHDHVPGITAAIMPELTADALFNAYRKRNTYGTTGEHVYLGFKGNGTEMGSEIVTDDTVTFDIEYAGTDTVETLRLYDGRELIREWRPNTRDVKETIVCRPWEAEPEVAEAKPSLDRSGRTTVLIPGTDAEKHFIVTDNGTIQLKRFRFTNMGTSIVYGFKLGKGEKATLAIDIDLQFKISASSDARHYKVVLEEPVHMKGGGNREVRRVDLTPFLQTSDDVFIKIEDKWKEDGLGGRFFSLTLDSAKEPEKVSLQKMDIPYRFKDRTHPYILEVVQVDGNRAWSSAIWVKRKTVPELEWRQAGASLELVNSGSGVAENVEIWYSPDETAYPCASVPLKRVPQGKETLLFAWTERVDHRRVRAHVRWYADSRLEASARIKGVRGYEILPNPSFRQSGGELDDNRMGDVEFVAPKSSQDWHKRSAGLDFEFDVGGLEPALLEVTYPRQLNTLFGDSETMQDSLRIPLNGRKTSEKLRFTTTTLKPGERWKAPAKPGYWQADPDDRINEHNKMDNFVEYGEAHGEPQN